MAARTKAQVLEGLTAGGIVPVIRADSAETAVKIVEALVAGGIRTLEITMTVPDAIDAIRTVERRRRYSARESSRAARSRKDRSTGAEFSSRRACPR